MNERHAFFYMLGSVVLYATFPLLFSIGDAASAPLLFNAIRKVLTAVTLALVFVLCYRYAFRLSTLKNLFARNHKLPLFYFCVLAGFDYTFFAWSLQYLDVFMATILYELRVIIFILSMSLLYRPDRKYATLGKQSCALVGVAFVGFVFVILSQSTYAVSLVSGVIPRVNSDLLTGLCIVFGAALVSGFGLACSVRWISVSAKNTQSRARNQRSESEFLVLCNIILQGIAGLLMGIMGALAGEFHSITGQAVVVAVLLGIAVNALATLLFTKANLITSHLFINSLSYTTPIFALLFLYIADNFGVVWLSSSIYRVDLFILGASLALGANIIIKGITAKGL